MASDGQHCSFVLLAEFDIDRGALLTYQFPQPLGTDETLLANLMLPDGAERQSEDWTIFFLNQTPFNTIAPVLALETPELNGRPGSTVSWNGDDGRPELLYVLNLVRTKIDKTARRGAIVKAMAICTRHPFIQIFKPILLMALDDYYSNPSQECLARLFDAVNAMDFSAAPTLTRHEKLIMRTSDWKDLFADKFAPQEPPPPASTTSGSLAHRATGSWDSQSGPTKAAPRHSPSNSLDESGVFVGHEPGMDTPGVQRIKTRARSGTDASSSSSHGTRKNEYVGTPGGTKDTHFFQTIIAYEGHQLPIKMPLYTFPEEVGDYSLIQLIQTFSSVPPPVQGPQHPHLHTNGALTHPIMILFNALITGKRIIFLGHGRPAGQVSSYVLSACALGSGCGAVLRGFIERAFPYANLTNKDEWESIPAYIAGVTNPIFETSGTWDVLCDVGSGRIVISKDINANYPPGPTVGFGLNGPPLIVRSGTLKAEASVGGEDELGRPLNQNREGKEGGKKEDFKDSTDNLFIEDIISAIHFHFGESLVRARFMEYVVRFVRLAARYEEESYGTTEIGYRSMAFAGSHLGSGIVFVDDTGGTRELWANASRIEAWRRTKVYQYYEQDFQKAVISNPLQGFDLAHQMWRLRHGKNVPDVEVDQILRTIVDKMRTYDAVVELLSFLPPHMGGLLPLSFGLFHQQKTIRNLTVDIFNELRQYSVGVQFLQALNSFQRYAYVRQAHQRENGSLKEPPLPTQGGLHPPSAMSSYGTRTPMSRSESNLTA